MAAPSENTRWWPITAPVATTDSPWEDHTQNSTKKNKQFLLTVIPFCKVVRTGSFCVTKNVYFKGAIINHIQNKGYSEVFWHLTKFWFFNWKITSFTLQSFLLVDVFAKQNSSWQSKNRALSYPHSNGVFTICTSQFQNYPSPRANQSTTLHRKVILLNLQKQYKERKVGPTRTHDDRGGKFLPI